MLHHCLYSGLYGLYVYLRETAAYFRSQQHAETATVTKLRLRTFIKQYLARLLAGVARRAPHKSNPIQQLR